jgi:hypothetical protein
MSTIVTPPARLRISVLFVFSATLFLESGCGSHKPVRSSGPDSTRMTALAGYYSRYVGRHQGHLPPDEATLKNFMRSEGKAALSKGGATDIDALFNSERDGKPLVITYSDSSPNREFAPELIVAHEQTGAEGKRLAAFPSGAVRELDQAAYDALDQAGRK